MEDDAEYDNFNCEWCGQWIAEGAAIWSDGFPFCTGECLIEWLKEEAEG